MPLKFLVSTDQNMLLVDPGDPLKAPVSADALLPNHKYDVFVFLQNSDASDCLNVRIGISCQPGKAAEGKASSIRQLSRVDVPRGLNGARTIVFVRFSFVTRASGTGLLVARILPDGPELYQCVGIQRPAPVLTPGGSTCATIGAEEPWPGSAGAANSRKLLSYLPGQ